MSLKVYIAGPMTGLKNYNREAFEAREKIIRAHGADVFNPATSKMSARCEAGEVSYEEILRYDISELLKCNAIFMLDGWEDSKGAKLEHDIAEALGFVFLVGLTESK